MKTKKKILWVDQKTYLEIIEQLKKHGECIIEARGYDPIILKGCVKNESN